MAALSKTFSGDLSEFIAGKIWNEIKRRSDERDIEKREGDPLVKKAAKELLKDDDKSTLVIDKQLRDHVSKIFGAGIDVKLVQVQNRVETLSDNVSTVAAGIADTQKLIVNQNELLESKFDEILKIFGIQTKQEKERIEEEKYKQLELDLEEKRVSGKVNDILGLGLPGGSSGDLSMWFARMLMKGGGSLTRRLFNRFASTRLRRRTAVTLGKLSPNRWKTKAFQQIARRLPGGKSLTNRITREVAERSAIRATGKVGTKVGLKKFPIVSIAAGTIFAIERAMKGDAEGAALEFASGLAGTVPGKGTALSFLIDGILIKRDIDRANSGNGYERGYQRGAKNDRINPKAPWHGTEAGLTQDTVGDIMNTFTRSIVGAGTLLVSAGVGYGDSIGLGTKARAAVVDAGLGHYKVEPIPFYTKVGTTGSISTVGVDLKTKLSSKLPELQPKKEEPKEEEEKPPEELNPLQRLLKLFSRDDNKKGGTGSVTSPGPRSDTNLNHNGKIFGYVGDTGMSDGPHVHIEAHPRVAKGTKQVIPRHVLDNVLVGGRPLGSWTKTSPQGWRKHPVTGKNSTWHAGVDYAGAGIDGQPVQLTGPMKYIDFQARPGDTTGSGNNILITDGTQQYAIMHLQDGYNPDVESNYSQPAIIEKSEGGDNIIKNESSNVSTNISDIDWSPPSVNKTQVAKTVERSSSEINHVKKSRGGRSMQVFLIHSNIDNSTTLSFGSGGSSPGIDLKDLHLARLA